MLQRDAEQETGVLALQRSAGNRAVAARLLVARDGTVPVDAGTKSATLSLDDLGAFEIEGFRWGTGAPGARDDVHEVVVTARIGKLGKRASTLKKAAVDGRRFDHADLVQGAVVIHLRDVYISGYETGSGSDDAIVTFTLNFGSIHYGDDDKPQGKPDQPRWDPGGPGTAG